MLWYSALIGSYESVMLFADMGADINLKTESGFNWLHTAVSSGHLKLCKALVQKHDFDVHVKDNDGWTALHHSAKTGKYDLLEFFASFGTDIYIKTNEGANCLHISAQNGHLDLCKSLIDKHKFDIHIPDNNGWTALHRSAQNGSYELVTFFAEMGADIQLQARNGCNCLHIAAFNGYLNLCKALVQKHHFDVNVKDNDGWTALHHSARSGKYDLVEYFASFGTDIYIKTNKGSNCLHISVQNGHSDLCKSLIDKHKFDIHIADNNGWTALYQFAQKGSYELVTFLLKWELIFNFQLETDATVSILQHSTDI